MDYETICVPAKICLLGWTFATVDNYNCAGKVFAQWNWNCLKIEVVCLSVAGAFVYFISTILNWANNNSHVKLSNVMSLYIKIICWYTKLFVALDIIFAALAVAILFRWSYTSRHGLSESKSFAHSFCSE